MPLKTSEQPTRQQAPPFKPSNNIFYNGVISEMEDDEDAVNFDFIESAFQESLSPKRQSASGSFANLTISQKEIEAKKVYQQSRLNSFLFDVRQLISKSKHQMTEFLSTHPIRSPELAVGVQRLTELDELLKSTMGGPNQIKIFMIKKVIQILRKAGKIHKIEQYEKLISAIDEIAGLKQIHQKDVSLSKQNQFFHAQSTKNTHFSRSNSVNQPEAVDPSKTIQSNQQAPEQIRKSRRSLSMKLCLQKLQNSQQKSSRMQRVPYFLPVNKAKDFDLDQVLMEVDQIHQSHLKTWNKHNEELKQFEAKRVEIKQRHSSFHSKMLLNKKILRHSSLNQLRSSSSKNLPRIISFDLPQSSQKIQQPEDPVGLINETQYFSRQPQRKISSNQNDIRFNFLPVLNGKRNQESLIPRQGEKLILLRGSETKRQKSRILTDDNNERTFTKQKKLIKSSKSKSKSKRKKLKSHQKDKSPRLKSNSVQKGRKQTQILNTLNENRMKPAPKSGVKNSLKVSFGEQNNLRKALKLDR